MKKILLLMYISISLVNANDLIHPLDFKDTKAAKEKVMQFIVNGVKETYTKIGMGSPSMLRMMEKEELSSFKKLTKVENRKLLDSIITQYCNIGMCNYNAILMMYNNENEALKKKLDW